MSVKNDYMYTVDTSMLDCHGIMTPEGYQRIVVATTEKELERLNVSISALMKRFGISWILLSLSVKILKRIAPGQELKVETWHTWQKGVIYRRDVKICSKEGEPLAYACTFSSLFDIAKRRLCMDRDIYAQINYEEAEELFDAESRHAVKGDFEYTEEVSVRPHWIDSLGHVNNFKYGQLTFDNLPEEFAERTKDITRMEMFFTGELRLNESVKISRKVEDNLVEVAGTHATDGKSAFLYRIFFGE